MVALPGVLVVPRPDVPWPKLLKLPSRESVALPTVGSRFPHDTMTTLPPPPPPVPPLLLPDPPLICAHTGAAARRTAATGTTIMRGRTGHLTDSAPGEHRIMPRRG